MVVAREDEESDADVARDVFATASEPKQLLTVDGGHFGVLYPDTRRPSALHPKLFHLTETDQPANKTLLTGPVSSKRFDSYQSAVVVNSCRHMDISMSVDTTSYSYH